MKKSTILITGSNGFLGQYLVAYFTNKNFEVIATGKGICRMAIPNVTNFLYYTLDITDNEAIDKLIVQTKPDVVIHNAAMSKPDECHFNHEACILNNVTATEFIVNACKKINAYLIYVSTDFVFGENGPHSEETLPKPLNFYGQSKLLAEQIVAKSELSFAIMRPVLIYGKVWPGMKSNFIYWVQQNLVQQKTIQVVNDQLRTPTFVHDICKGVEAMIMSKVQGIYHLAGNNVLTPYNMAVRVANYLQLSTHLIIPVTSDTFFEPVIRAKKSGLKIDKAVKELGYHPTDFDEALALSF